MKAVAELEQGPVGRVEARAAAAVDVVQLVAVRVMARVEVEPPSLRGLSIEAARRTSHDGRRQPSRRRGAPCVW